MGWVVARLGVSRPRQKPRRRHGTVSIRFQGADFRAIPKPGDRRHPPKCSASYKALLSDTQLSLKATQAMVVGACMSGPAMTMACRTPRQKSAKPANATNGKTRHTPRDALPEPQHSCVPERIERHMPCPSVPFPRHPGPARYWRRGGPRSVGVGGPAGRLHAPRVCTNRVVARMHMRAHTCLVRSCSSFAAVKRPRARQLRIARVEASPEASPRCCPPEDVRGVYTTPFICVVATCSTLAPVGAIRTTYWQTTIARLRRHVRFALARRRTRPYRMAPPRTRMGRRRHVHTHHHCSNHTAPTTNIHFLYCHAQPRHLHGRANLLRHCMSRAAT